MDQDSIKNKVLQDLIEKMEDRLVGDLKSKSPKFANENPEELEGSEQLEDESPMDKTMDESLDEESPMDKFKENSEDDSDIQRLMDLYRQLK